MPDTTGNNSGSSGRADCVCETGQTGADNKRDKKLLEGPQSGELEKFGGRISRFGAGFAVCNTDGELVLLCAAGEKTAANDIAGCREKELTSRRYLQYVKCCVEADGNLCRFGEHDEILATVLKSGTDVAGVAFIDLGNLPDQGEAKSELFCEMLGLLAGNFQALTEAQEQIEEVSIELTQVYEELVLLHRLSTNMNVTGSDANYLQMACDSLTDIVPVEGIAILLEKTIEDRKELALAAGSGLIDINEEMAALLESRLAEEVNKGREALLDSEVDSPFRYEWPANVKNIVAVPLCGKDKKDVGFRQRAHNGTQWLT